MYLTFFVERNIRYCSTVTLFFHMWFCMVPRLYYNASPLRVCVDHVYSCHVMYTSRGSKHVKVHVSWKHTRGSVYMEGIRVKQKTRVLTRRNLPIESIALHYINILLVDQHNVTYGLFSSAHIKSWWISSGARKFRVKYTIVFRIKLMCLVTNLKQFYCLAHVHELNRQRNGKWLLH